MAYDNRSEKAETGIVPEVANLGIVRPPFVYLGAVALGLLLHFAWPVRLVPRAVSGLLGGAAVLVAVALFLWAVRTFRTLARPFRAIVPPPRSCARGLIDSVAIPSICLSRCSSSESHAGSTVSGYSS